MLVYLSIYSIKRNRSNAGSYLCFNELKVYKCGKCLLIHRKAKFLIIELIFNKLKKKVFNIIYHLPSTSCSANIKLGMYSFLVFLQSV